MSINHYFSPLNFQYSRRLTTIALLTIPIFACDLGLGGTSSNTASAFRVTESYDNRAIATVVDDGDNSVITAGIYVNTRTTLDGLLDTLMNEDNPGQGIFVIKHNSSGLPVWEKEIHMEEWNAVTHMAINEQDGSIVIVGHTGPMPIDDSDLKALDMFDDAVAKDADVTPLGTRPSIPYGAAKLERSWLLAKFNRQGQELFRRTWRECLPDTYDYNKGKFLCTCEAKQVAIGGTGNIYVSGTAGSPWPMEKVHIAAFDTNGNVLWDDLRSDLHIGPINLVGGSLPASPGTNDERTVFDNPDTFKTKNYDTARLYHYAWDLKVENNGNEDTIYATIPAETKSSRGMVKLNQNGDLLASRKLFTDDLVTTIKPLASGKILIGGQVDATGSVDHGEPNVTLLSSSLNDLSTYSYSVFDGVTFDMVQAESDTVFVGANVIGIANKDVSLFKLSGVDSNQLSIEWDNLYSTTPITLPILQDLLQSYSVDNGKRLLLNGNGTLALVGDAYRTEGVLTIDMPDEDFIEPIISGGLTSKLFGFIPLVSANFNVDLNLPDELHIGILGVDSVRYEATIDPVSGNITANKGVLSQELSTPYVIAQRANKKLVQVTRPWQYDDNRLRSITVLQSK